jgi:hypothetical protein
MSRGFKGIAKCSCSISLNTVLLKIGDCLKSMGTLTSVLSLQVRGRRHYGAVPKK